MNEERIRELVSKYNAMAADEAELREIERLISDGAIDLSDLTLLQAIDDNIDRLQSPMPSRKLDERFYTLLKAEQNVLNAVQEPWYRRFFTVEFVPKITIAAVTLIVGLFAGMFMRVSWQHDADLQQSRKEVREMKELLMLDLLAKESTTERLKAVSLTESMDDASKKVTDALIQTLNRDENVNVRLAALDALRSYIHQPEVRQALIRSISLQDSPLVQVALAELMAALQEKSSVNELERIVRDKNTPDEVKSKIRESIEVLI